MFCLKSLVKNYKIKKLLNKFKHNINSSKLYSLNIYKYTDFIIELDASLLSTENNYESIINKVILIYYYQIILFCKTLDVNKNLKNFLIFLPIIYKIIIIDNTYIEKMRLGLFEFDYNFKEYKYLPNYREFFDSIITSQLFIQNPIYEKYPSYDHLYDEVKHK